MMIKGKSCVMKRLAKSAELLWLFGFLFVAFGVAVCSKADLGVSMIAAPAFIIAEALSAVWSGISVGVVEYVFQGLLLVVLCIVIRQFRARYLLAFLVAVLYGYALDFFLWMLGGVVIDEVWMRYVMLIAGDMLIAFGVACFFRTYLPLQVYELFVAETARRFRLNLNKTKLLFDLSLLALTILLTLLLFGDVTAFNWTTIGYTGFHSIGIGTLITTAINSPAIAMMGKLVSRLFDPSPRLPKLQAALSN